MAWSNYQNAFFNFVTNGKGNGILEAVAGSGKTTTIIEAMKRAKTNSSIFLAFNKSIQMELSKRGVNARTFHSLCFFPVKNTFHSESDLDKLPKLCKETFIGFDFEMYGGFAMKLVSLAKQHGIGAGLMEDTYTNWDTLIDHYGLTLNSEQAKMSDAVPLARELFHESISRTRTYDFDDMLYLAVKHGISLPKFDLVFVDEAQDTNAIQRAIIKKILKPRGRVMAVGDRAQAIYGFRGADSDSMEILQREFRMTSFPLSISYRCPKNVVNHAKTWVPTIESHKGAIDGIVQDLEKDWENELFKANNLIVCRKTAPLIKVAFSLFREQIPVTVLGRDIGNNLKALMNKMKAKDLGDLYRKLDKHKEKELEKCLVMPNSARKQLEITDKVDSLLCLIATLDWDKDTIEGLSRIIDKLFDDKANAILLSTIHKAKGLEADVVFWLNHADNKHFSYLTQAWQLQQEANLCYVATTRAKKELYLIDIDV
jgi:superfamily I DNA/RNA helicase